MEVICTPTGKITKNFKISDHVKREDNQKMYANGDQTIMHNTRINSILMEKDVKQLYRNPDSLILFKVYADNQQGFLKKLQTTL